MKRWLVTYTRIPTNYNDDHTLVIEAESAADAVMLAKHHLADLGDLSRNAYKAREFVPPPAGRVMSVCRECGR